MIIADVNKTKDYYKEIDKIARTYKKRKVGFYGQPDFATIDIFKKYGYSFIDLDINFYNPNYKKVPDVYCHIIRDIVNNAIHLKSDLDYILCTTGKDKCDQGRAVLDLLCNFGFKLIDASNNNTTVLREPIISTASGNLTKRVIRIMELLYKPLTKEEESYYKDKQCTPSFNFHGVPPYDISLLDIFPNTTHVEGWTRLVEMGTPALVELEWNTTNNVPTVYFAQSFCNKQMMASFLAQKHMGLYIDGHGSITESSKAKLEAFLTLRQADNIYI